MPGCGRATHGTTASTGSSHVEVDALELLIAREALGSEFAAEAAVLDATEGGGGGGVVGVALMPMVPLAILRANWAPRSGGSAVQMEPPSP